MEEGEYGGEFGQFGDGWCRNDLAPLETGGGAGQTLFDTCRLPNDGDGDELLHRHQEEGGGYNFRKQTAGAHWNSV